MVDVDRPLTIHKPNRLFLKYQKAIAPHYLLIQSPIPQLQTAIASHHHKPDPY